MNPRVSRSSALASKATGFPIAKIAARLAVGYALEEIDNDITGITPASFEPTIDYVVVKWPRFAFEKFPGVRLRAVDPHEVRGRGDGDRAHVPAGVREGPAQPRVRQWPQLDGLDAPTLLEMLERPASDRYEVVLEAFRQRRERRGGARAHRDRPVVPGASCARWRSTRRRRSPASARSRPVDTCAAEFPARTPYYYSGWEREADHELERRASARAVVILGSGPNRIGQGIEFDYCCVHAAMTVRESGRDAVMINCNPETVSTDYDTSDRLYFEPLTLEDVLGVIEVERPQGVIVQFGGQTPLKLAAGLRRGRRAAARHQRRHASTSPRTAGASARCSRSLGYKAPPYATARSLARGARRAAGVGFPLLVRPSYVLGGRAMEIVYSREGLEDYLRREDARDGRAIFLDRFLENAIEVDVDALCDGARGLDRRDHAARRGGRACTPATRLRAAAALAGHGDARARSARHARASRWRSASSG